MENLECGVYIATHVSNRAGYTFIVSVATNGAQSWLRLRPEGTEVLYTYTTAASTPRGYTFTRISEALQEVFLK